MNGRGNHRESEMAKRRMKFTVRSERETVAKAEAVAVPLVLGACAAAELRPTVRAWVASQLSANGYASDSPGGYGGVAGGLVAECDAARVPTTPEDAPTPAEAAALGALGLSDADAAKAVGGFALMCMGARRGLNVRVRL